MTHPRRLSRVMVAILRGVSRGWDVRDICGGLARAGARSDGVLRALRTLEEQGLIVVSYRRGPRGRRRVEGAEVTPSGAVALAAADVNGFSHDLGPRHGGFCVPSPDEGDDYALVSLSRSPHGGVQSGVTVISAVPYARAVAEAVDLAERGLGCFDVLIQRIDASKFIVFPEDPQFGEDDDATRGEFVGAWFVGLEPAVEVAVYPGTTRADAVWRVQSRAARAGAWGFACVYCDVASSTSHHRGSLVDQSAAVRVAQVYDLRKSAAARAANFGRGA